jgi:hypothetical protein
MVLFPKLPENSSIEYTFGSSDHSESPQITSVYAGFSGFAGTTKEGGIRGGHQLPEGRARTTLEGVAAGACST